MATPGGGWSRWWECLESSGSGDSGGWIEKKRRLSAYVFFVLAEPVSARREKE
jgi:hypothetical protein